MASAATLLRPGDVLGGFRVDDVIGIGGMAIVYRAQQASLGRPVALKVLSGRLTSDPVFRERFRREGTHAAALEHPNIVPVYDSGEEDGQLYLAMRLVDGTNLAELIQTRGLTADQTIDLLKPIAGALDTAHAAGLIHRDVKPQNILITSEGHPYLADFGVAKGSNTYGLTATGGFVGSVNYASPEQIKGLTLTPASDVYALTAVIYQCLTGHVPYPRETDAGVMHAHLTEPPPTLPTIAGVDSEFHTVLARGMAKDPGARYGHAGDLLNAAGLCVGRLPGVMRKAVPAFPSGPAEGQELSGPPRIIPRARETEAIVAERIADMRSAVELTGEDRRRPQPVEPEPVHERRPPIDLLRAAGNRGRRPAAAGVEYVRNQWRLLAGLSTAAALVAAAVLILSGGSTSSRSGAPSSVRVKSSAVGTTVDGSRLHVGAELHGALAPRVRAEASAAGARAQPLPSRAAALRRFAAADRSSADALRRITVPARIVDARTATLRALDAERTTLVGAVVAATHSNRSAYEAARREIVGDGVRLGAASRLLAAGAALPAMKPLNVARAPVLKRAPQKPTAQTTPATQVAPATAPIAPAAVPPPSSSSPPTSPGTGGDKPLGGQSLERE